MRQMRFLENKVIVSKGDVAREVYFLIHGDAHVCLHNGNCVPDNKMKKKRGKAEAADAEEDVRSLTV